jgi:hypothetical protein
MSAICSKCGRKLRPGARFCPGCGAPAPTGDTEPIDAKTGGTAVADRLPSSKASSTRQESSASCPKCGAARKPGATFCHQCGAAFATKPAPPTPPPPPAAAPKTVSPPRPTPPKAPPPRAAPPKTPAAAPPAGDRASRRLRRPQLIALVVAGVLVAAGGAFAAVRLTSGDNGGGESVAAATAPGAEGDAATETVAGDAGGTAPAGFPSTVRDDRAKSAGQNRSAGAEPSRTGPYAGAMDLFERYWKEVAAGDYEAAYGLYYPGWETTEQDFVAAEREANPKVAVDSLRMKPRTNDGSTVTLDTSIVLRDRSGQYAGQCRLLSGWVRFQRYGSQWKYRPGIIGGEQPSFAQAPENITGDPECP